MKYVIGLLIVGVAILWSGIFLHGYMNPVVSTDWGYEILGVDDAERDQRQKKPQLPFEQPFELDHPGSDQLRKSTGNQFAPVTVIPLPMPAITEIPILSADKASEILGDSELVLGVTIGDQSRAYPITMLSGPKREIINDDLGGKAIASTW